MKHAAIERAIIHAELRELHHSEYSLNTEFKVQKLNEALEDSRLNGLVLIKLIEEFDDNDLTLLLLTPYMEAKMGKSDTTENKEINSALKERMDNNPQIMVDIIEHKNKKQEGKDDVPEALRNALEKQKTAENDRDTAKGNVDQSARDLAEKIKDWKV